MANKPVPFGGLTLETTATVVGTAPSRLTWIVQKLTHRNNGGAAATVTVWLVQNGGAPSADNKIAEATLMAGETWSCPDIERMVLEGGGTVQAAATPATVNAIGSALAVS